MKKKALAVSFMWDQFIAMAPSFYYFYCGNEEKKKMKSTTLLNLMNYKEININRQCESDAI